MALHLQDSKAFLKPQGSPFISDYPDEPSFYNVGGSSKGSGDLHVHQHQVSRHTRTTSETANYQRNEINQVRLWLHCERIQAALNQANDAVEASQCEHGMVQVSLLKLQSALDALMQDMPKSTNGRHSEVRGHKRSTSIAYEALAFQ